MARPRKEIDRAETEKLMAIQCTEQEIAGWFGVSIDTINRRCKEWGFNSFADMYKMYSKDGKISLRRAQYQAAVVKGNVAMLIWLGKQYLGQSDHAADEDSETEYRAPLSLVRQPKSKAG